LPADAQGLLPGAREALDATLYQALTEAGFTLLPAERTARFIKDAVDAGLDCSVADDDCALRAGAAAGADLVVVPRAVRVGERLVMVLRLLSLDAVPVMAAGRIDDKGVATSVRDVAARLVGPEAAPTTPLPVAIDVSPKDAVVTVDGRLLDRAEAKGVHVWLVPGPHLLRVSAPGYEATQLVVDVPSTHLLEPRRVELERSFPALAAVGFGVAAVGGVIVGAGGIGAGIAELLLSQPLDTVLRKTTETSGRVLIGAAVVGVVAVSGGAALAVAGFSE
jgi:hypothetical protein